MQPRASGPTSVELGKQPHIPLDILYLILSCLHNDKPTLSSCTLVCHAWLPAARSHLFSTVVVGLLDPTDTFAPFLEFIESTRHTGEYIQDLALQGMMRQALHPQSPPPDFVSLYLAMSAATRSGAPNGARLPPLEARPETITPLGKHYIARILRKTRLLRCLRLRSIMFADDSVAAPPPAPTIDLECRRTLELLEVHMLPRDPVGVREVFGVLGLFGAVDRLAFLDPKAFLETDDVPAVLLEDIGLDVEIGTLELDQLDVSRLGALMYVLKGNKARGPETVCVAFGKGDWKHIEWFGRFLTDTGSAITSLKLDPIESFTAGDVDGTAHCGDLHLSRCMDLGHIALNLNDEVAVRQNPVGLRHCFDAYAELFEAHAHPALERVTLRVMFELLFGDPVLNFDWEWLDRALCTIPTLEALVIDFDGISCYHDDKLAVRLPRLHEQGKLLFRYHKWIAPFWDMVPFTTEDVKPFIVKGRMQSAMWDTYDSGGL